MRRERCCIGRDGAGDGFRNERRGIEAARSEVRRIGTGAADFGGIGIEQEF